jgi:membrane protease YdiL (CAAX protease family)
MPNKKQQGVTQQGQSYGRLQRGPTDSGYRIETFSDVLKRHGGTMGCLAAVCLMIPGTFSTIEINTTRLFLQPGPYLIGLLGLLVFFSYWSRRHPASVKRKAQWISYLLYISIVEELTFRLILPSLLSQQFTWLTANILSNLLFASIHYLTLRWKLRNCILTFLGGMGLSQLMTHGDFALVVMVHWLGTFLNTPLPPADPKPDDSQHTSFLGKGP